MSPNVLPQPKHWRSSMANKYADLEREVYEAFLRRGWVIPQTEEQVKIAEESMDNEPVVTMIWANEPNVSIYIFQGERDSRVIEIREGNKVIAKATVERFKRDELAEALGTGEWRFSAKEVSRLVSAVDTSHRKAIHMEISDAEDCEAGYAG